SDRLSRLTHPIPVPPPGAAVVAVRPTRTELPHFARPPEASERRRRRLRQEFAVRIAVTSLLLIFNETVASDHAMSSIVRLTAFIGLLLNVPYFLAVRTGVALRAQAYGRMLVDVALMTIGLYGAGGLGAAQYVGLYTIVPIYTAFVFSSRAFVIATAFATATYLGVVALQVAHLLPFTQQPLPEAWLIAAFNLLVVNVVGSLAALLAEAFQMSRQRLARLYDELERSHDESLK